MVNFYENKNIKITWQTPNNTEGEVYKKLLEKKDSYDFNYIAYPWANFVDISNSNKKNLIEVLGENQKKFPCNELNVTCFQSYHIWKYIEEFKQMNINIIFSPHCEYEIINLIYHKYEILILPIFLIPIITPDKKFDFEFKDKIDNLDLDYFYKFKSFELNKKKYDFSFIGSSKYNDTLVTKFRKSIVNLLKDSDGNNYIYELDKWHLNELIYEKDFNNNKKYNKELREINYMQNMYYSKYVICPKGIGPNSFRISEALKFNNIPIIISDKLMLPKINDMNFEDYTISIKETEIKSINDTDIYKKKNIFKNSITNDQIIKDKLYKNIKIANDYINNLANPIFDFFDERYNLLIVFYEIDTNSDRYLEYVNVMEKNLENNMIKKIYIFFEYQDIFEENIILNKYKILNNEKIKIIPTKTKYRRHISFNQIIEYSNKKLIGEKIIISNNDIYFQNLELQNKKNLILKKLILCITRTNFFDMGWEQHDKSQDTWIYTSPIIVPRKIVYIGWQGCDNRLAYEFYINGYNLSNPLNDIKCMHYQKNNNINEYIDKYSHQGDGFILNVPFCKINEFSSNFKLRIDYFLDHRMIFRKDLFKLIIFSNNDILNNRYIENYKNKIILKDKIELENLLNKINEKYILLSDENLIIKNTIVLKEIKRTDDLLKEILNKYINIYLIYKL